MKWMNITVMKAWTIVMNIIRRTIVLAVRG